MPMGMAFLLDRMILVDNRDCHIIQYVGVCFFENNIVAVFTVLTASLRLFTFGFAYVWFGVKHELDTFIY